MLFYLIKLYTFRLLVMQMQVRKNLINSIFTKRFLDKNKKTKQPNHLKCNISALIRGGIIMTNFARYNTIQLNNTTIYRCQNWHKIESTDVLLGCWTASVLAWCTSGSGYAELVCMTCCPNTSEVFIPDLNSHIGHREGGDRGDKYSTHFQIVSPESHS